LRKKIVKLENSILCTEGVKWMIFTRDALFLFKYKITLSVMQDSSHLTVILCSSVIKIVISQKQKVNRKNNNN
jgi:hypothetical protein